MMALTAHMDDDDDLPKATPRMAAEENRQLNSLSRSLVAAYVAVGAGLIGAGIGWAIDRANDSSPRWTLIVAAVLLGGGIYNLVREVRK